jgi:ribonuclease Y
MLAGAVAALAVVLAATGWRLRRRSREVAAHRADLDLGRNSLERQRAELAAAEAGLSGRAHELDRLAAELEARGAALDRRAVDLDGREQALAGERDHVKAERERLADLTEAEARAEIERTVGHRARQRAATLRRQAEQEARREAERTARQIIVDTVARIGADQASQAVVSVVDLPADDIKGSLIGREGRNIRAFEQLTGTDLIIDDTPGVVLVSCFDPRRRALAVAALEDLVADGRIHPSRIEAACERAREAVLTAGDTAATQALAAAGVTDLDPEIMGHLANLHFRTSYGQNVLAHLVESAQLAGAMAAEIGLDAASCRRAAFLHDIGKAITPDQDGSHAALGAEIARRAGESPVIVNAIAAHHGEVEPESAEAVLTQVADAISGGRPGARREWAEDYATRLRRLEEIALSHSGIDRVFAVRAGREVRVMVLPAVVDDARAAQLAAEIAHEIESELVYPGQIAVTVIRESRATATAA